MNKTKTVLVFLVCALAGGLCFGRLLTSPWLQTFWYFKGDKFLIPTYRYYLGAGLFLFLGLWAAYFISRMTGLFRRNISLLRKIVSGAIVAFSPLVLFASANILIFATGTPSAETPAGTILLTNIDPITLYLVSIIAFVLLISLACWILTARLYYVGVMINLLTLPLAFALLYVVARIVRVPGEFEFITYPIYFSMLAATCGFWISASQPSNK